MLQIHSGSHSEDCACDIIPIKLVKASAHGCGLASAGMCIVIPLNAGWPALGPARVRSFSDTTAWSLMCSSPWNVKPSVALLCAFSSTRSCMAPCVGQDMSCNCSALTL